MSARVDGGVVAVVVKDSVLRDFVSRLVVCQYKDHKFLDCDLTRSFCKRLLEDTSELVGSILVWELPLPARSLRHYEEAFIVEVLPVIRKLSCVLVIAAREDYLPVLIGRASIQRVEAHFRGTSIDYRCYDYRADSRQQCLISLVEGSVLWNTKN